jgi:hypothetical protein
MKLAYEKKRDSYGKFLLDSHDTIFQNDTCANSDVEMKDSENNVTPVSQPALVQDVGAALWDVSLDHHESVRDDPNFFSKKTILMTKSLIRVQQIHRKLK